MNEQEWAPIAYLIDNAWGQPPLDADREAVYFQTLSQFEAPDVEAAVRVLLEEEHKFTPSLGMVLGKVRKLTEPAAAAPTFEEAWFHLRGLMSRLRRDEGEIAITALGEAGHGVVASWVQTYGWQRLMLERVDGDDGGKVLFRLKASYDEFVARAAERLRLGQAVEATERRLGTGPERLQVEGAVQALESGGGV